MTLTFVSENVRSNIKPGDVVVTQEIAGYIKIIGITFCRTRFYGSRVTNQGVLLNHLPERIVYSMKLGNVVAKVGTPAIKAVVTE